MGSVRIVRGDAYRMIGQVVLELLGGTVKLPQVKDFGGLLGSMRPWCGSKDHYRKQQTVLLKTMRPKSCEERFFRECHSSESILRDG